MASSALITSSAARTKPVSFRVDDGVRALIDQAASLRGQSRADFIIAAARRAAEEALLDEALAGPATGAGFLFLHGQDNALFGYAPTLPATVPVDEPLQLLVR